MSHSSSAPHHHPDLPDYNQPVIAPDVLAKRLLSRESAKAFRTDKRISDQDFDVILEAARLSPSSFGWEPWKFVVLQNQAIRDAILPKTWGAQLSLPTASHYVLVLGRRGSQMTRGSDYLTYMVEEISPLPEEKKAVRQEAFETFQNRDFDLTDDRKRYDHVGKQTYIALANMMTAASLLGIDSCPIEGFNITDVEQILADHNVYDPTEFGLTVMVAFGYRKDNLPWPKTRRPKDDVIEWVR